MTVVTWPSIVVWTPSSQVPFLPFVSSFASTFEFRWWIGIGDSNALGWLWCWLSIHQGILIFQTQLCVSLLLINWSDWKTSPSSSTTPSTPSAGTDIFGSDGILWRSLTEPARGPSKIWNPTRAISSSDPSRRIAPFNQTCHRWRTNSFDWYP